MLSNVQRVSTKEMVGHAESSVYVEKIIRNNLKEKSQKMIVFRNLGLGIFIAASASGCASIVNSDTQAIYFSTKCEDVDYPSYCTVTTGNKKFSLETPAKIPMQRTNESLLIICESSISGSYGVVAYPFLSPAFMANVGLGGLVGATLDIVSNKAWAYPSSLDIKIPWCPRTHK